MSDLQQRYAQIQKALNHGCHDRACVIEKTIGMVTNGGCDCLRDLSFVDRQRVGQLLLLGQEAIAQLTAAEADRLAYGERVRDAAAKLIQTVEYYDRPDWAKHGSWAHACETYAMRIRALDLDALAEGEK